MQKRASVNAIVVLMPNETRPITWNYNYYYCYYFVLLADILNLVS